MRDLALLVFLIACAGVMLFHLALILGAPLGRFTQGGAYGAVLPPQGRALAGLSLVIVAAMALAILSAAGRWPFWPAWTGRAALALLVVSAGLNLLSPSSAERRLWAPLALLMAALAALIVLS